MASKREITDIRGEVTKARQYMQRLDKPERDSHEIETGAYKYEEHVPKQLGKAVVRRGRRSSIKALELISAINWPLRPDIRLPSKGARADDLNDRLEGWFANIIKRIDPRGAKKMMVHNGQVRDRAAWVWVSVSEYERPAFKRPKREGGEERAAYDMRCADAETAHDEHCRDEESRYNPYRMELLPSDAVGILPRDGDISFACVEMEMDVLEIARRFGGGGKDTAPLEVLGKRFDWLRARDGKGVDGLGDQRYLDSKLTVYMADDGVNIYCYVEQPASESGEKYKELEVYPNTFGRPSLVPFYGIRRDGLPPEQAYEGLLWPFTECERNWNITHTLILTMAANRRWVQPPPKEGLGIRSGLPASQDAKSAESTDTRKRTAEGEVVVPAVDAELQDVSNKVDEALLATLEDIQNEWAMLSSPLTLLNPNPDQIEKGTAAVVLYGTGAGLRVFQPTIDSTTSGYATMFRMFANHQVVARNPHLRNGENSDLDRPVRFSYLGTEDLKNPHGAGEEVEIPPSAFKDLLSSPDSIRVNPVATTEQQRMLAMRNQAELMAMDPPLATPEDVFEAGGYNNVSEKMGKIRLYQMQQLNARALLNASVKSIARRIALRQGRDENLMLLMFAPEQPAGAGGPAQMGQGSSGGRVNTGFTYNPPPSPTPAANSGAL
ncbi:MAG: hypothetical protein A3E01_15335 [Gammaproteobacteria bacterium RIFCSPHIGHO2_12_FULL_63_22]|nr:MAG: hypothetical protein A3E01_15335 [Gammaproteobacteria bacterium RIFCSPHIGHO2_12_FULL_63_22]